MSIKELNTNCLSVISSFLTPKDLVRVGRTCLELNGQVRGQNALWSAIARKRGIAVLPGENTPQQVAENFFRTKAFKRGVAKCPQIYVHVSQGLRTPAQLMTALAFFRAVFTAKNGYESYLEVMTGLFGALLTSGFDTYFNQVEGAWQRNTLPPSLETHLFVMSQAALVAVGMGLFSDGAPTTALTFVLSGSFGLVTWRLPPALVIKRCRKACGRAFVLQDRAARTPLCKRVTRALSTLASPVVYIAKFARSLLWRQKQD